MMAMMAMIMMIMNQSGLIFFHYLRPVSLSRIKQAASVAYLFTLSNAGFMVSELFYSDWQEKNF